MTKTFYIDPEDKARELGIAVYADNPNSPVLKEGESGLIQKKNGKVEIYYNPDKPEVHQRFTIAHEIGHYACGHLQDGKRMFRDGNKSYDQNNYNIQEVQANNYAASLLMPKDQVEYLIMKQDILRPSDLAIYFKVSRDAMRIRMRKLGWLNG